MINWLRLTENFSIHEQTENSALRFNNLLLKLNCDYFVQIST